MTSPLTPLSPAETLLTTLEVSYQKLADGTLAVKGELDLSNQGFTRLPDLSMVTVEGAFSCAYNKLTSLEGAPKAVSGYFSCYDNRLVSLAGAPAEVGGNFSCHTNKLTSLEGAPQKFMELISDLGRFNSGEEIPETLRKSPETRAREEEDRRQLALAIEQATVLQHPLAVRRPLKLK